MNEPHHLNEAIGRVVAAIQPLPWADKIYPRVFDHDRRTAGADKPQVVPMAYAGNDEYIDARPDDEHASVVFFRVREVEKSDYDRNKHSPTHRIRARRQVTLMGWVNVNRLPQYDDDSGSLERLKIELKKALKYVPCVIQIGDYQDGPQRDVFLGYVVSADKKYDKMPFLCFRIDLVLMMIEPN